MPFVIFHLGTSGWKRHLQLIVDHQSDVLPNRYLIRFPDYRHLYQEVNPARFGN